MYESLPKVGHPTEMKSGKRGNNFSVYFDEHQIEHIDEIRWREKKSRSEMVRIAVEEYIKNHKDGNNLFTLDKWNNDPEFQAVPALLTNLDTWKTFILENTSKEEATKIASHCKKIDNYVKMKIDRLYDDEQKKKRGF